MNQIIPSLFALDEPTFKSKLEKLDFANAFQLDFMDGKFTQNKSVGFDTYSLIKDKEHKYFELHMMAHNPLYYLDEIKKLPIRKILLHVEVFATLNLLKESLTSFQNEGYEVYMVVNPQTSIFEYKEVFKQIDGIMFMGVVPGAEGQAFHPHIVKDIEQLHKELPELPLEVDGGISSSNIEALRQVGVSEFCVGSAISSSTNPKEAFETLEKLVKNS